MTTMKRFLLLSAMLLSLSFFAIAQGNKKMSPHLQQMLKTYTTSATAKTPLKGSVLTLMTTQGGHSIHAVSADYGLEVQDSIGRIYIVRIPFTMLSRVADDFRVERIEAEPIAMQPAMDVTLGQINATNVYTGTNLPQAFTGKGVAAGVFDNAYDFTHPAFRDANGQSRMRYYYDFYYDNGDGTQGRSWNNAADILALGGTQYEGITLHGTHVMGIIAGQAVNGKYQGMAPEADIYAVHFNSMPEDFNNPNAPTSANSILGFKYIFDEAERAGQPCVINFSSGESFTINRQRILESEALIGLTGPGRIIVTCAGNDGFRSSYMEKKATEYNAGAGLTNGVGGGNIIDMDIVTRDNQRVRFDFLSIRLIDSKIEKTIIFNTDSVAALNDTCRLSTATSFSDISLKIWKTDYQDPRGSVFHIRADMSSPVYMVLCGALCLLTSNSPAWVYTDIKYSPLVNIEGVDSYSKAAPGHSLWWPGTVDGLITVGATGYKSSFTDIDGNTNTQMNEFAAEQPGRITKFSSQGPTFDERIKPDVTAPGMSINAPFNSYVEIDNSRRKELTDQVNYNGKTYYYTAQSGTSMATPVVTGAIALWLQANPSLTTKQILEVFEHTCTKPDPTLTYPNSVYGYGQIDVYNGLLYILNIPTKIPGLSTHQPAKVTFSLQGSILTAEFAGRDTSGAHITVYDLEGRPVASALNYTIDLSMLPKGVYAVQLKTNSSSTTGSTLIRL